MHTDITGYYTCGQESSLQGRWHRQWQLTVTDSPTFIAYSTSTLHTVSTSFIVHNTSIASTAHWRKQVIAVANKYLYWSLQWMCSQSDGHSLASHLDLCKRLLSCLLLLLITRIKNHLHQQWTMMEHSKSSQNYWNLQGNPAKSVEV